MVATAQHLVPDLLAGFLAGIADDDLFALSGHDACDHACVQLTLAAAPAQHLDLKPGHLVGELEQPPRGRKQLRPEVGGEAEREDVHVVYIDKVGHLLHLGEGVEARFVTDQVVQPLSRGPPLPHKRHQVQVVGHFNCLVRQSDSGGDPRALRAVVACQDDTAPTPPGMVVVHLQREGRLAAVHGAVEELQLGAVAEPAVAGGVTYRGWGGRGHGNEPSSPARL